MAVGPNPYIEVELPTVAKYQDDEYFKGKHPVLSWLHLKIRLPLSIKRVRKPDRKIRERFEDCPGLKALQEKSGHRLSHELALSRVERSRAPGKLLLLLVAVGGISAFLVYWYTLFLIHYPEVNALLQTLVPLGGTFLLFVSGTWYLRNTRINERKAAYYTYQACFLLEKYIGSLSNSSYRKDVMKKIERVARAVERIPFNYRGKTGRSTVQQLFYMAGERAAYIRGVNVWAAAPLASTRDDLDKELLHMLEHLIQGRWSRLNTAPLATTPRLRRAQRIALLSFAALLAAGLVCVNIFAKQLGPTTTIISSAIGVGLALVLPRSGLAIETLQQGMVLGPKLAASDRDQRVGRD